MASVAGLAPARTYLKGRLRELLCIHGHEMVEMTGIAPALDSLQSWCLTCRATPPLKIADVLSTSKATDLRATVIPAVQVVLLMPGAAQQPFAPASWLVQNGACGGVRTLGLLVGNEPL